MSVVTDVHTYLGILGLKNGISQITGFEKELFPKSAGMRNMVLAVFAQIGSVGINNRRCVIKNACLLPFINGNNNHHLVFTGIFCHQIGGGPGNRFCRCIPGLVLTGTEIRSIEYFLQAQNLNALPAGFFNVGNVLLHHRLHDFSDAAFSLGHGKTHLDKAGFDNSWHKY